MSRPLYFITAAIILGALLWVTIEAFGSHP